jgi:tetratricopeptide (TPR) repeat protein
MIEGKQFMTPDWFHQLLLVAVSLLGSGALWYFLSQRCYHLAIWTGFSVVVLLALTIALWLRNDVIKRSQDIDSPKAHTENILKLAPPDLLRKEFLGEAEELANKAEPYLKAAANDYEERRFQDAIKNCQKSIDVLPSVTGYLNLSAYLTYTSDHRRTEEAFVKGIQLAQKKGDVKKESTFLSNRAGYYAERGQQDKAILDLNRAIELDPGNAAAHFNLAAYYCEMSFTDRALEELDKAMALDSEDQPRDLEGRGTREYSLRGSIKSRKGLFDEAIRDFDKAIQANPKFYPAYIGRGIAYLGQNHPELAISDFDKAITLNPRFAGAYSNRGAAYAAKGMLEKGISDCDVALKIDPRSAQSYFIRGRIHAQMTSYDKAISDFNKAIEINPKNAQFYLFRGRVFNLNGENGKALLDFKRAIELNPNDEKAYFHQAKALHQDGVLNEALHTYDKAISINPAFVDALVNRAALYVNMGQLESALSDLNRAIKINPKCAEAYNNRGAVYFQQHQSEKALHDFNEAISLKPQYADALFNRANMYKSIGEYGKAAEDFKRACSLGLTDACKEYETLKNKSQP